MRRRSVLAAAGLTAAGGAATAYGVSRRNADDPGDESRADGDGSTNGGDSNGAATADPAPVPEDREGMVVFTYDDSPMEDYTFTYEIHREYDVPGCVAACPGRMEEHDAFLDPEHLREMQEDGWGVMSHTYHHRALGRVRLAETAREGDDRVYVDSNRHGDVEGDPLVVFDGDRSATATVAGKGSDSTGAYVELEEPLSTTVDAPGHVRYTEPFIRDTLERTDDRLEEWGLDVTGFVYPYDRYHGVAEDVVREHYDAVANHRYGRGHNDLEGLDPTTMRRTYIETDKTTEAEVDQFMETAAAEDVLSIVGAHSNFDTLDEERLRYAIEAALENGLAIVTVDQALAELGLR